MNYQNKIDGDLKRNLLIQRSFLTMISISLFCCCQKVFNPTNTWMIVKKYNEISIPVRKIRFFQQPKHVKCYSWRL